MVPIAVHQHHRVRVPNLEKEKVRYLRMLCMHATSIWGLLTFMLDGRVVRTILGWCKKLLEMVSTYSLGLLEVTKLIIIYTHGLTY